MNFSAIATILATLLGIVVSFMVLPIAVAFYYHEFREAVIFAAVMVAAFTLSGGVLLWSRRRVNALYRRDLTPRDGFIAVTLSWLLVSFVGSLPFWLGGSIPSFTNAFFETMSGFTTTGASVLADIEALPRSLLFWRSLTQWLGGMGIVVLTVAIIPLLGIGGLQLLEAEAPGPSVDRLTPRIGQTAKLLWGLYLLFTVIETILLVLGGLSFYDAVTHTFATLSTGGFSPKNASVGFYHSAYVEWVVTIFMLIGGTSFTMFYLLFRGRFASVWRSSELRAYLIIFFLTTALIAGNLFLDGAQTTFGGALRAAAFQVSSVMTTTGFASTDFARWPFFAQAVVFFLMFVGGCAGSTGGGIKVIRLVTLFKLAFNEIKYLIHPRGVFALTVDGRPIRKEFVYSVVGFFFIYIFFVLVTTLVVASAGFDLTTSMTTALATVGNIGPGLALVGPMANYAQFPSAVLWWLSFAMLVGRLEIYTVLVLFSREFWRR